MTPGYLRQPTLCGETLVFVCDDDLWRVSVDGGVALRLTAGLGEPSTPALSPDGQWLAFVGRDEQHPEVYLMPAQGGPARRMTWLGPDVQVRGFTPEGRILFVTTHGQPFFRNYRAHTIDVAGGLPELLPWGQVNHLAYGPGNALVIGRNTSDPARWKRYRGGTAGYLWIDAAGSGQFRRMTELAGNVTSPMWVGNRVYFLGDAEGVGNLYSVTPDGRDLTRHTDHADFYARFAQTDGTRIVYQCGAELWRYDPATDATRKLAIEVPSARTQAARKFVSTADSLGGFHAHPAGHSVALDVRGKPFTMALWEGPVRQFGIPDGVRHRHPQWLADGTTVVAVSDESGEERVQSWCGGVTQAQPWDIGRAITMKAAPHGSLVAIGNHRNEVIVGDVTTGEHAVIDRSDHGRTEDLAWSPDGKWLAYTYWTDARHVAIKLYGIDDKVRVLATDPEFRDYAPAFDPTGKFLYFLSLRTFDPVYDAVQFELSFPRAARPYLVALAADAAPPFEPAPRGLRNGDAESRKKGAAEADEAVTVRVDIDGLARRVAPFPVAENRFGQIAGVAGNKVIWTVLPIVGAHGRGGHREGPGRLELFDFQTLRAETIAERVEVFDLAADATTLVVRDGKRLRAIPANRKLEGPEAKESTPSRTSGWLDLERIRAAVDPGAEWRQMLREVWRLQRDHFWTPDMSGVDWEAVYAKYAPLLPRVATRGELSDLIWELQGELGTSHAYEMGGDHRRPPPWSLGQLGVTLRLAANGSGYEIVSIVAGDAWDRMADSPLNAIGVAAKVGERIVAVNGQPVSASVPPQALLVHQAGAKVGLTLDGLQGRRQVTVTTLADEVPARYREWVEANRAYVHATSHGRVGYLHLPDMQSAGFAEFHRYFGGECDRDALVVDLRYNRGGHVSQLLLEKIARKRTGYALARWMRPSPYPDEALAGPVVALTNEHAGSDGDIFSHNFKLMALGPLVGTRTWGGVIGIWPRHRLVDGTETTQPEFSFWFRDVGFGVENYGTDPTIEIDNAPQDACAGRDRQLEVALVTALDLAAKAQPALPDFGTRPALEPKALPPRRRKG
ncbi:MAG: PDZ domain-containing protein [Burkholderiales bacterium]|nr:PDZ domain-containing protein [Burkholderiales bacterium]